ncbi:26S proteasome regulatory subunit 10B homolog A [Lathyrus oleraceus]|nr:26S proteasome regulatory subunit 10B homolog A-like [Pisum sativum]
MEILKIHAAGIAKHGEIDYEAVVKLAEVSPGADLRNVCTEVGMSAIRAERDYVIHGDFMKAVKKLNEAKQLESSARYNADGNLQAVCRSISELVLRKPVRKTYLAHLQPLERRLFKCNLSCWPRCSISDILFNCSNACSKIPCSFVITY